MKVRGQRAFGRFGDGAGHLNAGRASANHNESHQAPPLVKVRLVLGALEGKQDATAEIGRVVDGLEPRREDGPIVVAKSSMPRAVAITR